MVQALTVMAVALLLTVVLSAGGGPAVRSGDPGWKDGDTDANGKPIPPPTEYREEW